MDILSTNVANNIPRNLKSTVLTNSDEENVRRKITCYILHTVLLVIILLFIITIICYHYENH